jgi:hypothetical protein
VGEDRTLGGFYPALYGEKVISGGSIRDSPPIRKGRANRPLRHHGQPFPICVDRADREKGPGPVRKTD